MRKSISAVLSAIAMTCLAVPFSASFAQAGISTNPPSVETRDYLSAVQARSKYEVDSSRLALTQSQPPASRSFAKGMVDHHTRVMAEHARLMNVPATSDPGARWSGLCPRCWIR